MWTTVEPALINLADTEVKVTMHFKASAVVDPTITQLIEVLPKGYAYMENTLLCEDGCQSLFWRDQPVPENPEHLLTTDDFTDPATFSPGGLEEESMAGGDPWDIDPITGKCADKLFLVAPEEVEAYQKLEWNWSGGHRPVVKVGEEAKISFKMRLDGQIDTDTFPWSDSPWLDTDQNQCMQPGANAGRPLELSGFLITLITATQGNTSLDSLVRFVFAGADTDIEIQSQRYGKP